MSEYAPDEVRQITYKRYHCEPLSMHGGVDHTE
jgi:hypothetical protein